MKESIEKLEAASGMLNEAIRESLRVASEENPLAEIILIDLLTDAVTLSQKIINLSAAMERTR